MSRKKREIIRADRPGFYSRPEAYETIVTALGLPEPSEGAPKADWRERDRVYWDLAAVFSNPNIPTEVIGNGTSGRLKQVHHKHLYDFAKQKYGIEVLEWKPATEVRDERVTEIEQVLTQHQKGIWTDGQVIEAIRRIIRLGNKTDVNGGAKDELQ